MYRFLLKGRWIALTAFVAVVVVAMVWAGFWQLRRLHERQALNALVQEREASPPEPVDGWLHAGESIDDARRTAEWRTLTATGSYDAANEVVIRNRSFDSAPGYHVVTPLRLADGTALLVNRGWIPLGDGRAPVVPAPPPGTLIVEGRVRASQQRGWLGPRDPAQGTLRQLARVDVPRLQQQLPYTVLPAYIELTAQQPALTLSAPRLIPPPELDDGPHLSYAVQWFIFSTLAVAGWVLLVRRQVKQDRKRRSAAATVEAPAPTAPTAPV